MPGNPLVNEFDKEFETESAGDATKLLEGNSKSSV
tara:strand:+ start:713 stop:817 length:105 start_codon:yes stop_codon:yes gene_type:complete